MMGMDQGQRSNSVGFNPAYLPNGEGNMQGAGTYSGTATEPTIQDYENFFGPSARDIKTDLQRFKRHGRWHLPDILQGPNPWLTDRIDGLITDATNSPFTTKILPYRYKEEVDGKIKWNVWSFDEGMASRVPYESAARTLTQSKRSFAGYMVRQGMAIVLEHNFMMTPKGRENFKNQLNQLIGSIQYTNDLDVHMALILAPSYQKTMRERYYTSDKSASQLAREFADLFGMMQKNVNALDILIEEGKAILRTWGGPMPDFLLCNSKLTFQMTMTPEKTNYITQGIDGVKRLRQGPDLGSYRGLSIIHSRAFVMEMGQHPRDVLRRRVRTAEYYRILPDKRNVNREFELYNEERDNWFTLSFHELLRYARYIHSDDGDGNAGKIDLVYHSLTGGAGKTEQHVQLGASALGAYIRDDFPLDADAVSLEIDGVIDRMNRPASYKLVGNSYSISAGSHDYWYMRGPSEPLFSFVQPQKNFLWDMYMDKLTAKPDIPGLSRQKQPYLGLGPFKPNWIRNLYSSLRTKTLYDPYAPGQTVASGTPRWFAAFAYYQEIVKRAGVSLDRLETAGVDIPNTPTGVARYLQNLALKESVPSYLDISGQVLNVLGAVGSVNHPMHMLDFSGVTVEAARFAVGQNANSIGLCVGRRLILTTDVLEPLLSMYQTDSGLKSSGLEIVLKAFGRRVIPDSVSSRVLNMVNSDDFTQFTLEKTRILVEIILDLLNGCTKVDSLNVGDLFSRQGVSTIPLLSTSISTMLSPYCFADVNAPHPLIEGLKKVSDKSYGHLSLEVIRYIHDNLDGLRRESNFFWFDRDITSIAADNLPVDTVAPGAGAVANTYNFQADLLDIFKVIGKRIQEDPVVTSPVHEASTRTLATAGTTRPSSYVVYMAHEQEARCIANYVNFVDGYRGQTRLVPSISVDPVNITFDLNEFFESAPPRRSDEADRRAREDLKDVAENVEIVIIRPNIEHNMLGVIMGLGGNELGNTLWGQTELSVYDDSMHGIWGMSYKYHERAIVFNEKNLIRMWDIAYDGYNGGKDDTYVDWTDEGGNRSNGYQNFKEQTVDLSKNYRGPSMMVMAFVHDRNRRGDESGQTVYNDEFRRNWPSPIVFYDSFNGRDRTKDALPLDYDNVQNVDVEEFRVFNNNLYAKSYSEYREMMPDFRTMHLTRKSAGQSSADAETSTDCLAFQGSMRIKEGASVQEIHGSGHHGPDYTGVASVRAGKGQKVSGAAPILSRLV